MSCSPCSTSSSSSQPSVAAITVSIPTLASSSTGTVDSKTIDYLERRRKNNDAARKSREVRRQREQSAKLRMEELEEENRHLHEQLAILRLEYSQLMLLLLSKPISSPSSSECSSS